MAPSGCDYIVSTWRVVLSFVWFLAVVPTCVLSADCPSALFPYGPDVDDDSFTTGAGHDVVTSYSGRFVFYDRPPYTEVFISVDGRLKFRNDVPAFFNTPFISPFQQNVVLTDNLGEIFSRQSSSAADVSLAQEAITQVFGSDGGAVTSVVVVTWDGVQANGVDDSSPQNTYQLVLATTSDNKTYSIFNYGSISWFPGLALINPGDLDPALYVYGVIQSLSPIKYCTNMFIPGRVLYRVDTEPITDVASVVCDDEPLCESNQTCTVSLGGDISRYDGTQTSLKGAGKLALTKSNTTSDDPCRFLIRTYRKNNSSNIRDVSINIGIGSKPTRYARLFDMKKNKVVMRGEGVSGGGVTLTMPYSWENEDTAVHIDYADQSDTTKGWVLQSTSGCGYTFYFNPNQPEPAFTAVIESGTTPTKEVPKEETCGVLITPST